MKKTSYLAIAWMAAGLSVSAQAQTIAMYLNSTNNTSAIVNPQLPAAGGTPSQGRCAFMLSSLSVNYQNGLPSSANIFAEPITVTKRIDNCSHAWFPSPGTTANAIESPFPVAAIYIYQGTSPTVAMIINLTNVTVKATSFSIESGQSKTDEEVWQLLPSKINIIDKSANTSVTCDYVSKVCS